MRAVVLRVVCSVALASGIVAASGEPPGYLSATLPNGLEVSILADPSLPVVATQVWYHVGSANEEPRTRGFAHLFEHLMFGGTPSHPEQEYWDHHLRFGGDDNAYTSFDETVYVSEIPPAGHDEVIELEADRMIHLTLTQDNLDNEKRIVTEELRLSTENDPFSRVGTAVLAKVMGEHPYALTPAGTKADIAAATLEQAHGFYSRYYRPRNAHVVIVGPVEGAATLDLVRRTFGSLSAEGATPPDVPALDPLRMPADIVEAREDLPPVEVAITGFVLPPPDHPDATTIEVLLELLTGGNVNPFEEELVRRRGKALAAGTETLIARRGTAIAFFSAALPYRRRATAFRLMDETRSVLGQYAWLDEERLASAKRKLALADLQRGYYAASLADAIGRARWWRGDGRLAFTRASRIESVTVAEVRAAFARYVRDAKPIRVYIAPENVPLLVRLFGWMVPLVRRG